MKWGLLLLMLGWAAMSRADIVVSAHTMRAGTILTEEDLTLKPGRAPGSLQNMEAAIGKEARVVLYAGRPIRPDDIAEPAVVHRNQAVALVFEQAGLRISTGGRALDRGAVGETIRVMNTSSRKTLFGRILADGSVDVSSP